MAPPKKNPDDLKNQRIPIMMSEDELKAIDDWKFENRIASRGEAIRRLCQIGLDQKVRDEAITQALGQMLSLSSEVLRLMPPETNKAGTREIVGEKARKIAIPFFSAMLQIMLLMANKVATNSRILDSDLDELVGNMALSKSDLDKYVRHFDEAKPDEFFQTALGEITKSLVINEEKEGD